MTRWTSWGVVGAAVVSMAALAMMLGLQAGQATAASVDSSLAASASGVPTSGNAPLNVSFTGSATGGTAPYTYSWNFGDGSATSTTQDPSHTYTTPGTYTATLIVTDSSSPANTATSEVIITVNSVGGSLAATASGAPTSGSAPLAVSFTGSATGGTAPYTYSWEFGDGSTSSAQNPSHTYTAAGTYNVTLTVTDSESPAKSVSAGVNVTASPSNGTFPSAPQDVTATPGTGQITLNWQVPASDGGEQINAYEVFRGTSSGTETLVTSGGCSNLGDVLTCTDTGLTAGTTYYYYLVAANPIGTGPQSNEANTMPLGALAATASGDPTSGNAPLFVNFTGSASGGTPPYAYSWNFGDGSATSTTQDPSHTYSTPGTYTATLIVTDSASPTNTATSKVTITVNPQAVNTVTVTNPGNHTSTVGTAVSLQMQATDSQSGQTLTWSATGLPAGLSINSISGLISGTPTTAGTSSVTVRATDTTGASGSASFSWTVNPISASSLCQLTLQDVQSSARYQQLPVSAQDFLDTLATAGCEQLDNIVAGLSVRQKAESLRAYDGTAELLADTGWLTHAQASSLQALAATL